MRLKNNLKNSEVTNLIKSALNEDLGQKGDITSGALLDKGMFVRAQIVSKDENVIICGIGLAKEVFWQIDKRIQITSPVKDGKFVKKPSVICELYGPVQGILKGERTALNFLGRMSGIATLTFKFSSRAKKFKVKVLDTRKTTPGLRLIEKYAVRIGGGFNHRFGLDDQALIKDNHIKACQQTRKCPGLDAIIRRVRKNTHRKVIVEIEVNSLSQMQQAASAGPEIIMLDNMSLSEMRKAVKIRNSTDKSIKLEASGNVNLDNVARIAKTGVDFISVGQLTHSAKSSDFSLKIF
ncbi:MAG: carboxylating nicotinate-nucleotide diphosphorylase [Candidatus Omnitrophota bacterium]